MNHKNNLYYFILIVFVLATSCRNHKAQIVDQIRVQQNLIDSLKREGAKELSDYKSKLNANVNFDAASDTLPQPNYTKMAAIDMQVASAQKNIDSLQLELKKY
jgi:hypothetical protein